MTDNIVATVETVAGELPLKVEYDADNLFVFLGEHLVGSLYVDPGEDEAVLSHFVWGAPGTDVDAMWTEASAVTLNTDGTRTLRSSQ